MKKGNMKEDLDFLTDRKSEIEKKKRERERLIGKKDSLLENLNREFKIESIKEAKKLLEKLKDKKERLEKQFEDGMKELRESYDTE